MVVGGRSLQGSHRKSIDCSRSYLPEIVTRLVKRNRVKDPIEDLTAREREVLQLMAEGRSNASIWEKLFLSPNTLSTHIGSIFSKLDLPSENEGHRRVHAVLAFLRSADPTSDLQP